MADVPSTGGPSSYDLELAEPPSWSELYATVRDLTLRAQTGGAEGVLSEMTTVLHDAREAGALRIVHRLLYITALCNMQLGHLDECVESCNELTRELTDDPLDRGWSSSAASMRAIVRIMQGSQSEALAELLEAAIQISDAPPRGPAYIWAVNGLGVGYLALRMYELALAQYEWIGSNVTAAEASISDFFRLLNEQLAHLYWGIELDRIESDEAAGHFERALELGAIAATVVPAKQLSTWEVVLGARSGLCHAFLGRAAEAVALLEPVVEPLARHEIDDTIVARLGLVRAFSGLDPVTARAHAERALLAVGHTTDYALALGARWERARLQLDDPSVTSETVDYALMLARDSWEERTRRVESAADRIAAEIARRQARKTEGLFYDPVTGLPNRFALLRQLDGYVGDSRSGGGPVGLAFIALDAEAPDDLVQTITATLPVDYLACYGSTELVAMMAGSHATELARRITACGADVLEHVTVGVASLDRPGSVAGLVAHADEALLEARRTGGMVVNPASSAA